MRLNSDHTTGRFAAGIAIGITLSAALPAGAQSVPSRLQGPARIDSATPGSPLRPERPTKRIPQAGQLDAALRKERFRREAAEAAQKQLEKMAVQLRAQLGKEIAARQAAEALAADLLARTEVDDQIDRERERLRAQRTAALEQRRNVLERMLETMTKRLAAERAKREQLESEKTAPTRIIGVRSNDATTAEAKALKSQVATLKRQLVAAEWARKLAEAQLKLITEKTDTR